MSKEVNKHEQLTFDFDEEYPSLLEPLEQKEKELGASSPDLIPLKIKLINFYFWKGDVNNVYKYLKSAIELIHSSKNGDLPLSNYLEQLSGPATVVDQNISGAGMVDRLDEIAPLEITTGLKAPDFLFIFRGAISSNLSTIPAPEIF
jgi:hypothetical protein